MKKQHLPSIVVVLILTVVTVVAWIALDVYRALTTKPAPPVSEQVLEPLNPVLDEESLDKLVSRNQFSEESLPTARPLATPTPAPVLIQTPEATVEPISSPSQ
jgi:hypothetical protein